MHRITYPNLTRLLLTLGMLMPLLMGMSLPGEFARLVEAGNRLYGKGEFKSAAEKYDKAVELDPESAEAAFNAAAADYRLENFDDALKGFSQAANTAEGELARFAQYNAGNAYFRLGELDDAIEAYKKALTLDPTDERARFNLEFAQRRQQQQQQGAGGKQDKKDQQKQKKQPQQKPDADKQKQEGQQSQAQNQDKDETKPEDQQGRDQQGKDKQQDATQATRPMDKEQADQLLKALAQEDANVQKIIRRAPMTPAAPTDKDW